jgi:hypothetical protein
MVQVVAALWRRMLVTASRSTGASTSSALAGTGPAAMLARIGDLEPHRRRPR